MRKALAAGILGVVLAIAARLIYRACVSDETRIRWLAEGMVEGFNGSRAGPVLDALDGDFRELTARVGKTDVHAFLVMIYLNERDPATKEFRFRVSLGDLDVQVARPGGTEATVNLQADVEELLAGQFTSVWKVSVAATLKKRDEGWKILSSRYSSLEGKRPF